MKGLAPLLGTVLGLAITDTAETEPLEGTLRADRTVDLPRAAAIGEYAVEVQARRQGRAPRIAAYWTASSSSGLGAWRTT